MTAQICTSGQEYWAILKRVREHGNGQLIRRVAVKDMQELLSRTQEPALRNRMLAFINVNRQHSPSNDSGGSGPRRA